jgi:hypothetical protein
MTSTNSRKANQVMNICDGISSPLRLKDFVVFGDNWVGEEDKILYDEDNNIVRVLGFEVLEINVLVMPDVMPVHNGWALRKFSAVKLDREVKIGDRFYTSKIKK